MAIPTLLTELVAVNLMLSSIGEAPISDLTTQNTADVALARSILDRTNVSVQSKGWHFNTEYEYNLTPDVSGNLNLPANCVRVDTDPSETQTYDVTQRGLRLYDRANHTYVFTAAIKVEMIVLLDFNDLPEAAKQYITIKAARIFQDRVLGNDSLHAYSKQDEMDALVILEEHEQDTEDPSIFDNYDVYRIIDRRAH